MSKCIIIFFSYIVQFMAIYNVAWGNTVYSILASWKCKTWPEILAFDLRLYTLHSIMYSLLSYWATIDQPLLVTFHLSPRQLTNTRDRNVCCAYFRSAGDRVAAVGQLHTNLCTYSHVPSDCVDGAQVHAAPTAVLLQGLHGALQPGPYPAVLIYVLWGNVNNQHWEQCQICLWTIKAVN